MFEDKLEGLGQRGLLRSLMSRASAQGPVILIGGKEYVNFSSNDYLGLSGRKELADAADRACREFGFGAGASRLLGGGSLLHEKLERLLADFKKTESALLFNSGYSANTGIIPAISEGGDCIFSDELNHASIIDGCRLSNAKVLIYRHRDINHLDELIKGTTARRRIVVTDSVFSMDGDIAPLLDISALCRKHEALFYIDDAHGTGVLGGGRGAIEHFGIQPDETILQMGTISKALGSLGAFASGSADTIQWLANTSRTFVFSTALPQPVVAASIAALEILLKEYNLVTDLWINRNRLMEGLRRLDFQTGASETPIIPVLTKTVGEALALSNYLLEHGIYAPAIRPPTVKRPRVRLTVTAVHTEDQIEILLKKLEKFRLS